MYYNKLNDIHSQMTLDISLLKRCCENNVRPSAPGSRFKSLTASFLVILKNDCTRLFFSSPETETFRNAV